MKRLFGILLAALLALSACSGNLRLPRLGGDELAGRVFPENAPDPETLPEGALLIEEYAPTGTVPWQNLEGGVWALFSKPVVPLGKLGRPASASSVLSLRPELPGVFRWYGSRLLSFEPEGPLAPATEYVALIDPQLAALDGSRLAGMDAFRFRTPPLQMLSLAPTGSDVPPEQCRVLEIEFNYPVELDSLRPSLAVEADGREVPVELRWPESAPKEEGEAPERGGGRAPERVTERRLVMADVKGELPRNAEVTVRLKKDARPRPGTYGSPEEQVLGFHTLEPFRAENVEVYDYLPAVEAAVLFNHPVAEENALRFIRVDLPGYNVLENGEVTESGIALRSLPVSFESTFTVTALAGLKDVYGQGLPADQLFTLQVGPASSYVNFRAAGDRILEAGYEPLVLVEFQNALEGSWAAGRLRQPYAPLPAVSMNSYDVHRLPRNTRLFRVVDLAPYLREDGKGSAFARWEFLVNSWWSREPEERSAELRLQVTDLGVSTHLAHNRLLVWVTRLASGAAEPGAEVLLRTPTGDWKKGVTDASGLADFPLEPEELERRRVKEFLEVEVRKGGDRLVYRPKQSPSYTWNFEGALKGGEPMPMTWLASDRGIYRPGESLSFVGIDRDRLPAGQQPHQGDYRLELQRGWSGETVVARTAGTLSPTGRFWGSLQLPGNLEPAEYRLVYSRADGTHEWGAPVKIAFFRRVAFAVDLALPPGPKYMGDSLEASFSGKYLAGGAVNRGRWSYWWARREISYRPPDPRGELEGYRFGARSGGDEFYDQYYGDEFEGYYEDLSREEGSLGGDGSVTASQKLAEGRPGRVYSYELNATIEDVDRQTVSKSASLPVFTSELLIGARLLKSKEDEHALYFVTAGKPFYLSACTVDPQGSPYPAGKELAGRLIRESWKLAREKGAGGRVDTRWVREETVERSFTVELTERGAGPGQPPVELLAPQVGRYFVELAGRDRQGREALTRIDFYSTGSAEVVWQRWDEKRIELVPDQPLYRPGDKARLLIKSPLPKGRYLLTLEREGLLERRMIDLGSSTDLVEVELREEHIPVVYVSLTAVGGRTAPPPDSADRPDLGKPRGCFGLQALAVDSSPRRIELEILGGETPHRPGEEASLTLRATWQGKPLAGAEIALVAADRGVLDLIDYHLPDPLKFFYDPEVYYNRVHHADSRELLIDPVAWKVRDLPGGDKEGEEGAAEAGFQVRRDFRALAAFEPALVTGADGTANVRFRLPDSLTTFRVTAVAAAGERYGLGESELQVRNPLNVRAALPRLLRAGDETTAGVVITNLQAQTVSVTVNAASDRLVLRDKAEKKLTLKPGETREAAFRWSAPRAGEAAVSFRISSPVLQETLETSLPVEENWVEEAVTIVGQTEQSAQEALAVPAFLGRPGEGLELTLDSTIASSLVEAVRFLEIFPYDCLEQRTSKLFAYILYDWMVEDRGAVQEELAELAGYQTEDGGFTYWPDPGHRHSNYYVSARTAHLLALAGERGVPTPKAVDWNALVAYLGRQYGKAPPALQPYGLYVLASLGRDVRAEAARQFRQRESLGLTGRALLALTLIELQEWPQADALITDLRNYLRVGTRSVTLTGPVESWYYFGGDLQAKALLLLLYRRVAPDSQLTRALADDLLAAHRKGYWYDTSTTGWVLQAFAEYLQAGGERGADFLASVHLGGSLLAEEKFQGPSRAPVTRRIEPARLTELAGGGAGGAGGAAGAEGRTLPLELAKQGKGRLYYTATLRYALEAAGVEARDEGLGLAVTLQDEAGKGVSETLRLGQTYRVKAVLYSSRDRDFLVLRLPIPAGTEIIDGSLATSQALRREEEDRFFGPVQRLYDAEARFFFDTFPRGKQEVWFQVRATTPGTYRTPPATAGLMYEEEVFGRTSGRVYRIAP